MSIATDSRTPQRPRRTGGHIPGEAELWLFILGDLTVFGIFFGVWGWNYSHRRGAFEIGRAAMSQPIGLAETLTLITSSAAVAIALNCARDRQWPRASTCYLAAISFGGFFVALKAVEYTRHLSGGLDAAAGDFFMYYFVFTGIHLLHVIVGLLGLTLAMRSTRASTPRRPSIALLEGIGVYWHMVDVLWVVLFALIYLI